MKEIWKDIKGYEGYYQVSTLGRVKSLDRIVLAKDKRKINYKGKILKLLTARKYISVSLNKSGEFKSPSVHRIVAETFIDNPLLKQEVNHMDGNKYNNHVDNLEWCTRKENDDHARKTGLTNTKGENCSLSKLKEKDVIEIRRLYATGDYYQKDIAEMFGITQGGVGHIVRRMVWKHI